MTTPVRRPWPGPLVAVLLLLAMPVRADQAAGQPPAVPEAPPQRVELPTAKPPPIEPLRQVLQVVAPTEKPPPLERSLAEIPGPACTPGHRAAIEEALGVARDRLAEAIRMVEEDPDNTHIRRWFGSGSRKVIGMTLRLTAERLEDSATIDFHCNDPGSCPGGRFAYARGRDTVLGVCAPFFRATMEGTDSRWGILVHEASHLAANTRDHVYRPNNALRLAKEDPFRATENADNYEYFVETLPR